MTPSMASGDGTFSNELMAIWKVSPLQKNLVGSHVQLREDKGIEPSRPCGHRILSLLRLPVPPLKAVRHVG